MFQFQLLVQLAGCILVTGLITTPANGVGSIQSGVFEFPQVPAPLSVTWQLATSDGDAVSATWTGIQYAPTNQLTITNENAGAFGIDFSAWAQAVTDPAYVRSIITVNGVSKEGSVLKFGEVQELDLIHFNVFDYFWPGRIGSPNVRVSVSAVDSLVVPEPTTSLLAVLGLSLGLCLRSVVSM
jgi:hypothetical protein